LQSTRRNFPAEQAEGNRIAAQWPASTESVRSRTCAERPGLRVKHEIYGLANEVADSDSGAVFLSLSLPLHGRLGGAKDGKSAELCDEAAPRCAGLWKLRRTLTDSSAPFQRTQHLCAAPQNRSQPRGHVLSFRAGRKGGAPMAQASHSSSIYATNYEKVQKILEISSLIRIRKCKKKCFKQL
jgi:hypothetical protein